MWNRDWLETECETKRQRHAYCAHVLKGLSNRVVNKDYVFQRKGRHSLDVNMVCFHGDSANSYCLYSIYDSTKQHEILKTHYLSK